LLKGIIRKALATAGYAVFRTRNRYVQDGLYTIHNDHFRRDPTFQEAYIRGLKASKGVDPAFDWRVHVALWAAATSLRVPGDFVECGVNAGFISSAIMRHLRWNTLDRRFYLIDTFSGPVLDQYSPEEIARGRLSLAEKALAASSYVTDLARVRANYSEWPSAVVVQGAIPEVLPALDIGAVAFLHIDMNCAYPERAALEFFWNHLSPGAIVLLDDYAYFGHDQQTGAIDSTVLELGANVLSLPTGQGVIIK
jgi:methyltransferase family protein